MNLHGIVAPIIGVVNPSVPASFQQSTGSVTNPDGTRTPSFAVPVTVTAQVQELTTDELRQIESLNLQAHVVAIYLYGSADGVNRVTETGGDLITISAGTRAGLYLVTKVLERWPDWTKVAATLQSN